MKDSNIPALSGIRGIAALIVVISHFSNETGLFGGLLGWGGGQTGVMLFFVLAGYLMTQVHVEENFTLSNIGIYATKRIARVYPLFLIVAALPALLEQLHFPAKIAMSEINSFTMYFRQVTLIDRGVNVFWTIQIEFLFYFCFIAIWAIHRFTEKWMITLVICLTILAILGYQGFTFDSIYLSHLHYFLIGVISALGVRIMGTGHYRSPWVSFAGLSLLVSLPLTYPKVFSGLFDAELEPWSSFYPLIQITLLFNLIIRDQVFLKRILSCKPLVWIGKISYSVYLLHYFVLMTLVSWTTPSKNYPLSFTIFISIVFLLSWLSFKYLERPLQKATLLLPYRIYKLCCKRSSAADAGSIDQGASAEKR